MVAEDSERRFRQTKIVATLGPASSDDAVLRRLIAAGVEVFRLNFGHGRQEDHGERIRRIRRLEEELGRPLGIIADMQGIKLRIGTFAAGSIFLAPGGRFRLDLNPTPGDERRVAFPHPEVMEVLQEGMELVLDEGKVRLVVRERGAGFVVTEVVAGTRLSDQKGLNIPNVILPLSPLTGKDRNDLAYALDLGADWIALSFVQRPQDVIAARRLIGGRAGIIVKVEKPSAIDHLGELIDLSDGLMFARGDLGVEMPLEKLPPLQKRIVREARAAGKPVIIGTQMLETMIDTPVPTRAEASDVATAVYDGADAVLLSAETAVGAYPEEAVRITDRIIREVECDELYRAIMDQQQPPPEETPDDAITLSAHQTARTLSAAAIVTYTTGGTTSQRTARRRPEMPILGLTSNLQAARRLTLSYGVHGYHDTSIGGLKDLMARASKVAVALGLAQNGDRIVITTGVPVGAAGMTNNLRIAWVDDGTTAG